MARTINTYCGTALGPWDVDSLPEEWLDLFEGMAIDLKEYQAHSNAIEKARAEFIAKMQRH